MREHLGAVHDRQCTALRGGHVGHRVLDGGRDHERAAIPLGTAAVLRQKRDAKRLELRASLRALVAVEATIAAARFAAAHRLELRERAHAAAADAGVVEAHAPQRIGHLAGPGREDHDRIAFCDSVKERDRIGIREPHASVRGRRAQARFMVRAMQVDGALERVTPGPVIDTVLKAIEREDARQDQIVIARLAGPGLAGGFAADEHRPACRAGADAAMDAMPAGRCAERAGFAADAVRSG